jgi:hypothetical protein
MERDLVLDKLIKIQHRLAGKSAHWPPGFNQCDKCGQDISFQLAGLFLKDHMGVIIEALRRMD